MKCIGLVIDRGLCGNMFNNKKAPDGDEPHKGLFRRNIKSISSVY